MLSAALCLLLCPLAAADAGASGRPAAREAFDAALRPAGAALLLLPLPEAAPEPPPDAGPSLLARLRRALASLAAAAAPASRSKTHVARAER